MKPLKKMFFVIFLFSSISLGIYCNNENTPKVNDKKEAEERNDAKFSSKSEKDADFVAEAADINLVEMNLGQLAESHAAMTETKDLGMMMNRDHKKSYDELASLASKKSITIPSSMSESEVKDYNSLAEKKGADFDKQYCDMMVKGHKDAIEKFEKKSKDAADPDIQAWAANMLPTLRNHLDKSMDCQEKTKNIK